MFYNTHRTKDAPEKSAEDFMLSTREEVEEREAERVSRQKQNMIESLKTLAIAHGGRTPRRRKKARRK